MASYFEPTQPDFTAADRVKLANADAAASDLRSGTTSIPVVRPQWAAVTIAAPVGVNAYNALPATQIVAVNDLAAHMLIGILAYPGNAGFEYTLQLMVGAANAEVGIGEWPLWARTDVGYYVPMPAVPAIQIPANARVSGRIAAGTAGNTLNVRLLFIPRPIA